ncbi:MAG: T9SS type A sorting domain-containing protein [Bacteroidetes bacterium]|nr:T9SS type A sorting domain-containing protein [Bacteroidota bacterium]
MCFRSYFFLKTFFNYIKNEKVKVQVINLLGQKIFEENSFSGNEVQLNSPSLGIYFISITFKDKIFTQKIVVQ